MSLFSDSSSGDVVRRADLANMWFNWKFWLTGLFCVVIVVMTSVVGLRHRHTGEKSHSHAGNQHSHGSHSHSHSHGHSHSHSHSHGHTHAHGHGHSHSHGHCHHHSHVAESAETGAEPQPVQEGWHVHLFVLGWEITLWDHGVTLMPVGGEMEKTAAGEESRTARGVEILTESTESWSLSSFVLPLLVLPFRRVACSVNYIRAGIWELLHCLGRLRERPPLPPPRKSESWFNRF